VEVDLNFQRFATVKPQFVGERIAYGITIPSNAPTRSWLLNSSPFTQPTRARYYAGQPPTTVRPGYGRALSEPAHNPAGTERSRDNP